MDLLFLILPLVCVAAACGLLVVLTIIDLREFLLPDRYVFPFGALGLVFHTTVGFGFSHLSLEASLLGAALGGGVLLFIRWVGSVYYKQEAMGLGDVKLLTAAGLWLGPASTMMAMTIGAAAGLVHGIFIALYKWLWQKQPFNMHRLVIPAGPGFIVGIIVMIGYDYGRMIGVNVIAVTQILLGHDFYLWMPS